MALFMYEQMDPFPRTRILCIPRARIESDLEAIPGRYTVSRSRKNVMESGSGCVLCCNATRRDWWARLDLANLDYTIFTLHYLLTSLLPYFSISFALFIVHILLQKEAISLFSSLLINCIKTHLEWTPMACSYRIQVFASILQSPSAAIISRSECIYLRCEKTTRSDVLMCKALKSAARFIDRNPS